MRAISTSALVLAILTAAAPQNAAAHSAITLPTGTVGVNQIGFSGDDLLVGSPLDGIVRQIDLETATVVRTFSDPAPAVDNLFGAAVTTVGGNVAIGSPGNAGAVYLFDGANGMLLQTFSNPSPGDVGSYPDQFGNRLGNVAGDLLIGAFGQGATYSAPLLSSDTRLRAVGLSRQHAPGAASARQEVTPCRSRSAASTRAARSCPAAVQCPSRGK
jgi:hypothetical protein